MFTQLSKHELLKSPITFDDIFVKLIFIFKFLIPTNDFTMNFICSLEDHTNLFCMMINSICIYILNLNDSI